MNDGIMYTHNVVRNDSHGNQTLYVCAKLETAEYLRDWEVAEEMDRFENSRSLMTERFGVANIRLLESMRNGLDKFSIVEGEVIL